MWTRGGWRVVTAVLLALVAGNAQALSLELPGWGDQAIEGQLNTTITVGAPGA